MIILHNCNNDCKDVSFTIEQFKSLEKIINWKTLIKYIDKSSIDMEFIETFKHSIEKYDIDSFIMKSSNIDVLKKYTNKNIIRSSLDYAKYISEEFIETFRNDIKDWRFIQSYTNLPEELLEKIHTNIAMTNCYYMVNVPSRIYLSLYMRNNNLSEEFLIKYRTKGIEEVYKENFKYSYKSHLHIPSYNFLKVYKDITNWEYIMKYAPLKLFTKKFVQEFYDYIGPLCISMSNVDQKKIALISKYRKKK